MSECRRVNQKKIDGVLRSVAENRRPLARIRVTERRFFCRIRRRRGQRLALAEGASLRELPRLCAIKPVSPPRYAEVLCSAFFISATTLPLPLFRLTSLRVCAGAAELLFVLKERLSYLGYNNETFQQASAHPCSSGWDRGHPPLPSLPHLCFLFLQMLAACT